MMWPAYVRVRIVGRAPPTWAVRMVRRLRVLLDGSDIQIAGVIPPRLGLPAGVAGVRRTVRITPERIGHIRARRPAWAAFCLEHMPEVLGKPDFVGRRAHGDQRRVEFVRLVGKPARWLLVSVNFLDDVREASVTSAHPVAAAYLPRRLRTRPMQPVPRP